MDFTHFIANQEQIEPAQKSGLYIVQQSNLPLNLQAFRCGLAGKPSDAAQRAFQSKQSSFASRFAIPKLLAPNERQGFWHSTPDSLRVRPNGSMPMTLVEVAAEGMVGPLRIEIDGQEPIRLARRKLKQLVEAIEVHIAPNLLVYLLQLV